MQQLKMRLRVICNAILDQSIHAGKMTEKEAMELMMKQGYQQEGEAVANGERGAAYSFPALDIFVGVTEMLELRELPGKSGSRFQSEDVSRHHPELRQPPAQIPARVSSRNNCFAVELNLTAGKPSFLDHAQSRNLIDRRMKNGFSQSLPDILKSNLECAVEKFHWKK
jgi:hypothetical protein